MKKVLYASLAAGLFSFNSNAQDLLHYWNFNNSTTHQTLLTPTSTATGGSLEHLEGGASIIPVTGNTTGQGFELTNQNARNNDQAGSHLRFNNPIGGGLLFHLPTSGYQHIILKYLSRRSGQGAHFQVISYSINGNSFVPFDTLAPVDGDPTLQVLDFSSVPSANNNPYFKVRITFLQGGGGTEGNNRFDNFTAEGFPIGLDVTPPQLTFSPVNNAVDVPVLTPITINFNEDVQLLSGYPLDNENADTLFEILRGNNLGMPLLYNASVSGRTVTIIPADTLNFNTLYTLSLKPGRIKDTSGNIITAQVKSSFATIRRQTIFTKGDLVPVAYRMNATGVEDSVALLTLVNILPGTKINLTDAKYKDDGQCVGGIVWTAPSGGVSAGSVIGISTNAMRASTGIVTGSGFGLSSGGDQVIVYTGEAASPGYITALSSNAWITTSLMVCNGSISKIPSGLEDGTSSINLSTSQGNTAGNAVNAYYSGPQSGTAAQIRANVLNPANWIASAGSTAPQAWPTWAFPGSPSVVSAKTISQNTIQVIFNKAIDTANARMIDHYTGIQGLDSVAVTENGLLADTVWLFYNVPFSQNSSYNLTVSSVADTEGLIMSGTYTYAFTFVTRISIANPYVSVNEATGIAELEIKVENPSPFQWRPEIRTASGTAEYGVDFTYKAAPSGYFNETITKLQFQVIDDNTQEQDEYFVVYLDSPDATVSGNRYFTVYIRDNDRKAPQPTEELELSFVSRYKVPNPDGKEGLAEIVTYDPASKRLFTISTGLKKFDIVNFSNPAMPDSIGQVDVSAYGSGITSIAVMNGVVAVSVPGIPTEQDSGAVLFFDVDGNFQKKVTVGALPDMLTFSPDGNMLLTANEGQPNNAYTIDPEGSVSIIDFTGGLKAVDQSKVTTVRFDTFNAREAALLASGVRKLKKTSTLAQDFEPEYITVSPDSRKAWVALQENNAIAELDLESKSFTSVWALGTKDYSLQGNGFDASDRNTQINIANWPVKGFYMPDALGNYEVNGNTYIVGANEGDEKEYQGLTERAEVKALKLDSTAFPDQAFLKADHNLGRFRVTNLNGDTDNDGDFDELYAVGTRSFAIWNADNGDLVWDSGDDFEKITSENVYTSSIFNADNENNNFKSRSRAKGPEPEGVTLAKIGTQTFAFITLERTGGVMVYNITDPANPVFTDYKNSRDTSVYGGDNGPEGIIYISAQTSPDGKTYVVTANELSGTLAVFEVLNVDVIAGLPASENPSVNTVSIKPNPVTDGIVYFSKVVNAEISDLNGIKMFSAVNATSADVSSFPKGVYIIRINNTEVKKLVIR